MRTKLSLLMLLLATAVLQAQPVDLLARYPTQLTAGDAAPDHARPWQFTPEDIFRVERFGLDLGASLKVNIGEADLGIGHCADGAVWAVLLPRQAGTLTSQALKQPEAIANLWLRFHPAEINRVFPPDTVFADGDVRLLAQMRAVADDKFRSSWHAGQNAMIPEPKDLTVYADTKSGQRRFFMADTAAGKAEYVAAFERETGGGAPEISLVAAPPVVIKTVPAAGDTNVDASITEVIVTFSKPMQDGSWSWSTWGEDTFPELAGDIHYLPDGRTCVLPVKLKPGKFYASWLNSNKFRNFKDTNGTPAVPYLLTFQTAP
jgi:hypothetical protein